MVKKIIDWEKINQQLAVTQKMIGQNDKSFEETNHMLHLRANELAKEFAATEKPDGMEVIVFMLGSELYGIESTHVSRISEAGNITRLPNTPEFVEGIINVHGRLVCVINLKEVFGLPKLAPNGLNRIMIINHDDIHLGILADTVTRIESIVLDSLQTSLPTLTGTRSEFLLGITHDQKIILNVQKLLTHEELIINDYI